MKTITQIVDGVKYRKCKQCWEFKIQSEEFWYKAPLWFEWFFGKCKECCKYNDKYWPPPKPTSKVCTKCGIEKPLTEFYKRKDRNGLWVKSKCKECERKLSKEYWEKYRKTEIYNSAERKEKRKLSSKQYREKNKELISKKAQEKNQEKYYDVRYRLMKLWQAMKRRCYNSKCNKYCRYWGKWVKIERETFDDFYRDMSPSYIEHVNEFWYWRKNTQIDRIDPNWNYSKNNCRWVTAKENNARNHAREFNS